MSDVTLLAEKVAKGSHTPGPWWVDDRRPAGALQVQAQHRGKGSSYCVATVHEWEVPDANARLLAAAPELLETLQKAADTLADIATALSIFGKSTAAEACRIAEKASRDVIAKAEGK